MTDVLGKLTDTLRQRRKADPQESYVAQLHNKGLGKILDKVDEEAAETIEAAKGAEAGGDKTQIANVVRETADLWFHTMVMLDHLGASAQDVLNELERRMGVSGLEEKVRRKAN